MMWSPRRTFETPGPTSSTTPAASCPSTMGRGRVQSPLMMCQSLWQTPVAITRTRASPACGPCCPAAAPEHVLRKIQDLPASIAILAPDQYYRGYTLVVSKTHATELYHLDEHESTQYFRDMLRVAAAVAAAFRPRKMNYEVLGNTVAHLHWHLFPRYDEDPNPKRPTWERSHAPRLPGPDEYAETLAAIRRHLR